MSETTALELPADAGNGCWNRVGVWGEETPRCPLLESVVHCRNCEYYVAAGRTLLQRASPPGYLERWSTIISSTDADERVATESILVFRLGDERLALPTRLFEEVVPLDARPIHTIPHRRGLIKGLVNIRGRLQLCVSLGGLLGVGKAGDVIMSGKLLILARREERFVFPVSEVVGIFRYHPSQIQHEKAVPGSYAVYLMGVLQFDNFAVGVLHGDRVLEALSRGVR